MALSPVAIPFNAFERGLMRANGENMNRKR